MPIKRDGGEETADGREEGEEKRMHLENKCKRRIYIDSYSYITFTNQKLIK